VFRASSSQEGDTIQHGIAGCNGITKIFSVSAINGIGYDIRIGFGASREKIIADARKSIRQDICWCGPIVHVGACTTSPRISGDNMLTDKSTASMCLDHQPTLVNSNEPLSLLTVVLPEALLEQLDALAKRRTWKRSEAVTQAISNFINAQAQGVK
jgi:hypothetical protein